MLLMKFATIRMINEMKTAENAFLVRKRIQANKIRKKEKLKNKKSIRA